MIDYIKKILFFMFGSKVAVCAAGCFWDYDLPIMNHSTYKSTADLRKDARAILVVNTASQCGFTPQYEQLEELYQLYQSKGFFVLAIPSNDFFGQEPLSNEEIVHACSLNYHITFPITVKTSVIGQGQHPLYQWLSSVGSPKWNFHKYLIDHNGLVINSYSSLTNPKNKSLMSDIESLLKPSSD